jgi:hypothetical protein
MACMTGNLGQNVVFLKERYCNELPEQTFLEVSRVLHETLSLSDFDARNSIPIINRLPHTSPRNS